MSQSQTNYAAIIGAIAAAIISIMTAMNSNSNHNATHARIDTVVNNTLPKDVLEVERQHNRDEVKAIHVRQKEIGEELKEVSSRIEYMENLR